MGTCIIIGAAPVTLKEADYVKGIKKKTEDYLICADGGYVHALNAGFTPDLLMGDFDSFSGVLPENIPVIRFPSEKDQTDTYLAAQKGLELGYKDFLFLCTMGGRMDHTIASLSVLKYLSKNGASGIMADAQNEVRMIENQTILLPKKEGYKFSLLPFGEKSEHVFITNAKYPLRDAVLTSDLTRWARATSFYQTMQKYQWGRVLCLSS